MQDVVVVSRTRLTSISEGTRVVVDHAFTGPGLKTVERVQMEVAWRAWIRNAGVLARRLAVAEFPTVHNGSVLAS